MKIVCILGHNGAGKTTLLNLVAGTQKTSEGIIKFNGDVNIGDMSAK
jgi:ABC-type Fe3+/spermidine/putrescine transport system ATPase subunit